MKILFFTTGMTAGGAERVIATLSNDFIAKGHSVTIAMLKGASSDYPLSSSVVLDSAQLEPGLRNLGRAISFYRQALVKHEPDVVISFSTKSDLIALACRLFYKNSQKVIVSDRADPFTRDRKMQVACNYLYKYADLVVCQSEAVARFYNHKLEDTALRVIPNPLNIQSIGKHSSSLREGRVISIGRLSAQKNHQLALAVFTELLEDYPRLEMKIYGDGPLKDELLKFINSHGLGNSVSLEGVVPDVLRKNENAGLFLFTSDYEGYPNALLEAAATGIPTVTTDFSPGTASELISHGVNGYVVPRGNRTKLVQACRRALDNELDENRIAESAKSIRHNHDVKHIADSWLDSIESVLSR